MLNCEYSITERKLFRHFGTEELCEWFWPHQLYRETAIKAFCKGPYNGWYEMALKTALEILDHQGEHKIYRMTPAFDNALDFWMDRAEEDWKRLGYLGRRR